MVFVEERLVETEFSRNRKRARSGRFLANMPLPWIIEAGRLPGKALHVALAIRHQSKLRKTKTIPLGNPLLAEMGVSKDAKRRALDALVSAGLIQVCKETGKNPMVTIVEALEKQKVA